jgi:hypothetical protein
MRQPSGSKIQLISTSERLQLTMPARFRPDRAAIHQLGLTFGIDTIAIALIALIIYLSAPLSAPATDFTVKIALSVALLFLLPIGLWILKAGFRLSFDVAEKFLSRSILTIDRQQLTLSQHLFILKLGRSKQLKTKDIVQLVADKYQHPDTKIVRVSLVFEFRTIEPVRLLTAGQDLTEREIKWIGNELSQWLGVNLVNYQNDLDNWE